jgi:ribosomal protein L11 methyltransferase
MAKMNSPKVWRWRKRVTADAETLAHWESLIDEGFVPDGSIQQEAGRATATVEVFSADGSRVEDLHQVFGGRVDRVDAEALMQPTAEIGLPLKIRDRLLVTESVEAGEIAALAKKFPRRAVLSFPPELAFGTGRHATTGTCLRLLVDIARERERSRAGQPWRMLDLGHGSGILAVATVSLGAESAIGVDFDARAVAAGQRNAERHELPGGGRCSERCEFFEADISEPGWEPAETESGVYEVVAANLFADLLVTQLPRIAKWLPPDGDLVLSGILRRQIDEVSAAASGAGIALREPVVRGKWAAIRGRLV